MPKHITTILDMPEGKRRVDHFVRYCADNGERAEAHLHDPRHPHRVYCVMCPSGLNEAGLAIMGKQEEKHGDD